MCNGFWLSYIKDNVKSEMAVLLKTVNKTKLFTPKKCPSRIYLEVKLCSRIISKKRRSIPASIHVLPLNVFLNLMSSIHPIPSNLTKRTINRAAPCSLNFAILNSSFKSRVQLVGNYHTLQLGNLITVEITKLTYIAILLRVK